MSEPRPRVINQDLLIRAIADLNDATYSLFALKMLHDDTGLSEGPCDVEEGDCVTLNIGQVIDRLIVHLTKHLRAKE